MVSDAEVHQGYFIMIISRNYIVHPSSENILTLVICHKHVRCHDGVTLYFTSD